MSSKVKPQLDSVSKRLSTYTMKENIQPESVVSSKSLSTDPDRSSLRSSNSSSSLPSASRPNSHHRRRSSVSTRRESAEMMGVPASAFGDLPTQDNMDTDIVRRHALWALEGKFTGDSFNKVQIPELVTSDTEKMFELPLKNPFQLNNTLGGKRDSVGRALTPSLSSKDQLHTLVEEEEEEEDQREVHEVSQIITIPPRLSSQAAAISVRPLNIAPLVTAVGSAASSRSGLKPLTLATSPPLASPGASLSNMKITSQQAELPKRRSSLSYKRSNEPSSNFSTTEPSLLPTPELTPITAERPLSPSEHAFLSGNQVSLVSRIAELERALALRTRTMSIGTNSSRQLSVSSLSSDGPSDEMLCLVRDLKMERDDLVRDQSMWQTRVADLEKQNNLLTQRVEKERCELWQAKERADALDAERTKLKTDLDSASRKVQSLEAMFAASKVAEQRAIDSLYAERTRRLDVERELESLTSVRPEKSRSIASSHSSNTHVEPDVPPTHHSLKCVPEEEESVNSEGGDELAHYEDEEDDDIETYSDDSFSDTGPRVAFLSSAPRASVPTSKLAPLPSPSSTASSTPPSTPSSYPTAHARRSSLEQNWSFPKGIQPMVRSIREVDRFFDCLELVDTSAEPAVDTFLNDTRVKKGRDKYGFFSNEDDEDIDDYPPFIIPANGGAVLEMVPEEEEDNSLQDSAYEAEQPFILFSQCSYPTVHDTLPQQDIDHSEADMFPSSIAQAAECAVPIALFQKTQEDTVLSHSPMECATPKPPTFISTPRNSPGGGQQTPRKAQRSAIPRFSPSPKSSKGPAFPPTPISNPRVRVSPEASRRSQAKEQRDREVLTTPTKVVDTGGRHATTVPQAVSSNVLKSTTIASLASYLPWTGWAQPDSRDRILAVEPCSNSVLSSQPMNALVQQSHLKRQSIPVKKVPMASQMKKSDKLFLL